MDVEAPAPADALHDEVASRLRAVDQMYTAGRRRLVDALATESRPVTIPQLVDAHGGVAISSAYRNLGVLEQVGVVVRIHSGAEHVRFELAEALVGDHHHHLICESCGRVDDFTVPARVERTIERTLAEAADAARFRVSGHRLDLVGTCAACVAG